MYMYMVLKAAIMGLLILMVRARLRAARWSPWARRAQNFGDSSSQGSILASCSTQAAGTVVTLLDANGNELISCTAKKSFSSVVISLPEIQSGQTYTLKIGSATQNITMNGLIYGSGFGGFGGGGRWRP